MIKKEEVKLSVNNLIVSIEIPKNLKSNNCLVMLDLGLCKRHLLCWLIPCQTLFASRGPEGDEIFLQILRNFCRNNHIICKERESFTSSSLITFILYFFFMFYHIAMAKTSRMMLKRGGESEYAQSGLGSLSSEKGSGIQTHKGSGC